MRSAIVVDVNSAAPIHRQIYEAWRDGILTGRFHGGERVTSTRELADGVEVSRSGYAVIANKFIGALNREFDVDIDSVTAVQIKKEELSEIFFEHRYYNH